MRLVPFPAWPELGVKNCGKSVLILGTGSCGYHATALQDGTAVKAISTYMDGGHPERAKTPHDQHPSLFPDPLLSHMWTFQLTE